jgi:superfamily I DNA and RNA helicase
MDGTVNRLRITIGTTKKPIAADSLRRSLEAIRGLEGECFFGFPVLATPDGTYSVDAVVVSPSKGVILFDLVEGTDVGNYIDRQDDLANKVEARLRLHRELLLGRDLLVPVYAMSFSPILEHPEGSSGEHPVANETSVDAVISNIPDWRTGSLDVYRMTLSAIESLSSIRKSRAKRDVSRADSRGASLKMLEDSIATLDHRQNRAVIETAEGVQRIRGLAGSGKTIVLALKAAYLHTQNPDWRIAVSFHTRSLKGQFRRLINNFCIEQSGEEPDWRRIRILNAWGAPGGEERDGLYFEFCREAGHEYLDFQRAKSRFGGSQNAFEGACLSAVAATLNPPERYDAILVDEAQDFGPGFLRMCYSMLRSPKRLVYAYDELQNLTGISLPPPEEIFGVNRNGLPIAAISGDSRRDVILQKCYRNSRPVLATAHALGFGIYRNPVPDTGTGLVQMFDQPGVWEDIGYHLAAGKLEKGHRVVLSRSSETSPSFLEEHSPPDDLVVFRSFADSAEQDAWLVEQIVRNLNEDELRHDDIVVIHPDPITARERTGPIRSRLYRLGVQSHLAGVDTEADVFFRTDSQSVTFTGIYRAKGNEAGMVYVINAQDCDGSGTGLATLRNRLFTAITRSKAWVRVIGYGSSMETLQREHEALVQHGFALDFTYPTEQQLETLKIVHRDLSIAEKAKQRAAQRQLADVARALESGAIRLGDMDADLIARLRRLVETDAST